MTAPCLSLTGTKKQVCACLQLTIIPLPCGYSGQLMFVPSLLFSFGFSGSHTGSHRAISMGPGWLSLAIRALSLGLRASWGRHCRSCGVLG